MLQRLAPFTGLARRFKTFDGSRHLVSSFRSDDGRAEERGDLVHMGPGEDGRSLRLAGYGRIGATRDENWPRDQEQREHDLANELEWFHDGSFRKDAPAFEARRGPPRVGTRRGRW